MLALRTQDPPDAIAEAYVTSEHANASVKMAVASSLAQCKTTADGHCKMAPRLPWQTSRYPPARVGNFGL